MSVELVASKTRRPSLLATVLRRPALVVWCLFVALSPVYVFGSGLPQPGDMLVVLLAPLALIEWNRRIDRSSARTVRALIWFTVWVALVNYGWAFVLWQWTSYREFLIHPMFYLFNLLVFISALLIARRDRDLFLKLTIGVTFVIVVLQVAMSFADRDSLDRGRLFFNNPNQLGYFALLCGCLFAMTQERLKLGRLWAGIGVTACAYLATLSASRASLAGVLVLLMVLVFSNPRTIVIGSLIGLALVFAGGPLSRAIDEAEYRTTTQHNTNLSFAEERGYDRLWTYPEYLVLGAGEGEYERFTPPGERPRELHSSFGAMVFSYGVVGTILFAIFFFRVVRGAPLRLAVLIVPALAYTIAHQGLRFTMFWVVLAVFVVLKQEPTKSSQ